MPLPENTLPSDSIQSLAVLCSYNLPPLFLFSDGIPPTLRRSRNMIDLFHRAPLLGELPVECPALFTSGVVRPASVPRRHQHTTPTVQPGEGGRMRKDEQKPPYVCQQTNSTSKTNSLTCTSSGQSRTIPTPTAKVVSSVRKPGDLPNTHVH